MKSQLRFQVLAFVSILSILFSALGVPAQPVLAAPAGTALQLNGSNHYVTFGPSAGATTGLGVQVFTIELWFKRTGQGVTTSTGTGGLTAAIPLVTKGRGEGDNSNLDMNYFFGIDYATNRLAADFEECAALMGAPCTAPGNGGQNYPAMGTTAIQSNVWYHAAVTYDGQNWKFYLNGAPDGTTPLSVVRYPRWDSIQHAGIGTAMTSTGAAAGFFAGMVDEVRIWNIVRTEAEIQGDMYSELTSGTGLIGRWGLNEGSGTTAGNSVAGRPDGTLTNGPNWVAGFPIPDTTPPAAPAGLSATAGNKFISLAWNANSEIDLAGYNLYRAIFTGGPYTKVNTPLITGTSYIDTNLTNGTPYYYVLRAVDTSNNESEASSEVSTTPAESNTALQFTSASGTYVTFGDPAKLDLATFTIETWFKRTGPGTPNTTGSGGIPSALPLVTHGSPEGDGSNVDANWILVIDDTNDVIAADFEDMATGLNHPVYGITPILNDTWHHAAATYDGSTWRLYLDGNLERTLLVGAFTPRSDSIQQAALGTMIRSNGTVNGFFQGVIDEARVWNVARTQAQIRAEINNELTSGGGLVARWGLNDGIGTVVTDSILTAANGTVAGTGSSWVPGAPFNLVFPLPATPSGVNAVASSANNINLTWTDNSGNEDNFEVERGADPGGPFSPLASVNVNITSYADTTVLPLTQYCYRVRAVNVMGASDYSNVSCATTPDEPQYGLDLGSGTAYVTFGDPNQLDLGQFTLETWFKRTGPGTANTTGGSGIPNAIPLVTHGAPEADGSNVDANWILVIDDAADVLGADFEDTTTGLNHPVLGTTSITNNVWHHAAATFDGSTWKLYLDGRLEATLPVNAAPRSDSIQRAGLGAMITSAGAPLGHFQGVLDEVRVWNYARTRAQILSTINSQVSTPQTGLVGRWSLNEGSGAAANGSAGTAVNGTITNTGYTWVTPGAPFNVIIDTTPPAAPTNLMASARPGAVQLEWTANTETDLTGYNVYRSTSSPVAKGTPVNGAPLPSPSFIDSGVTAGQLYYYAVAAVDSSNNESGLSNEASAIPLPPPPPEALALGSSNAYVNLGDSADIPQFTLETWLRRDGAGTAISTGTGGETLVPLITNGTAEAETAAADINYFFGIRGTDGLLCADFEEAQTGSAPSLNHPVCGVTPLQSGVWYHAAATYDGTTWRLYLNGALDGSLPVSQPANAANTSHLAFGTSMTTTDTTAGYFNGVLDEVRIWNYARTGAQIASTINVKLPDPQPGLIGRWGMDEGSGSTVSDSSGNGIAGTITGSGYSWVPGSPFNAEINLPPDAPVLVAPSNGATNVTSPATLSVSVSDPESHSLNVTYYGRPLQAAAGPDFTIVAIPDPQYYASSYPSIYNTQMQWVADNKANNNIIYVVSLGDNVDVASNITQWTNADTAWDILDAAGVPYGVEAGNHDGAPSGTANFNTYFGASRYAGKPTYGGHYGSDNDNHYDLFSASGMNFIAVFIEYDDGMTSTSNPVLQWANGLLQTYADRRAIVITHNLLQGGTSTSFSTQGSTIYNALKANPNLFLMMGGHLDVAARRTDTLNGNTVYSLRSDYQSVDSQQSGYLRVMRFSPADDMIYVTTYSPTQNKLYDKSDAAQNNFNLPYTMEGAGFTVLGTVNGVASGGTASLPWPDLDPAKQYEWFVIASDGTHQTPGDTWNFTTTSGGANHAPVVTNPGTQNNSEGDLVSLQIEASDEDPADTLAYSASGLPDGLNINTATGLISGTLSYLAANSSPYSVTVTVDDGTDSTPVVFDWSVPQAASGLCGSDPGLVGCWPFEEGSGAVIIDASRFGNDGNITGSPTRDAGQTGQALHLSGTGQYAVVPDDNSLDISNQITLAAWIKPERVGTQNILKKTLGTTTANGYELSLSSSGKVFVRLNGNASYRIDSTTSYPTDGTTWMHVAATFDGTTIRLYINGVGEGSKPGVAIVANNTNLGIGAEPAATVINLFKGALDDVRVYDRALSLAEIQALAGVTTPTQTLTVTKTGSGSGTVTSSPDGINCGGNCSYEFEENAPVTLTAAPDGDSTFTGWGGACSGAGTCEVTMDSAKSVSAEFTENPVPAGLSCTTLDPKPLTAGTGEKPQSKVWNYAGTWWAVLPTNASGASSAGTWLWKLQGSAWTEVLKLSNRTDVKADARSLGNVVHVLLYAGAGTELVSAEYSGNTYQLWTGRSTPSPLALSGSEIATIEIDSTGRMWLATENDSGGQIVVYHSDSPYSSWSAPVTLATNVNADDISVLAKLPNQIGVLWSNQNTQRFGFRVHNDGDDPSTWSADEVPASQSARNVGLGMADDHLNVKVASDGTLYAAVKTSYDTLSYPKVALLVRRPSGIWDDLYYVDDAGTRGNIELDEVNGVLTYLYTQTEGYAPIVYRQSSLSPVSFGARQTLRSESFNDVSSTKEEYDNELVVIYGSSTQVGGQICHAAPISGADLAITKDDGLTSVRPNDPVTYTVTVTNNGPETVTGAAVTDTLPAKLAGASWTCSASGGASCSANGTGGINDTADLPVGGSLTYTLSATVGLGARGDLSNTAAVNPPAGIIDPISGNNTATDTDAIISGGAACENDATLVGCWPMEENGGSALIDGSSYLNDAALNGNPDWVTGQVDAYALDLDGSTDYGLVPDDASLDLTNAITLVAWIKPEEYDTADLIKKAINGGVNGYELSLATTKTDASSRKVFFRINQVASGDTYRVNSTTEYPIDGSWMHVAATFDGATLRMYINGVLEGTTSAAGQTIATNTLPLTIGAQDGASASRFYQGWIDDVRVYNRALTLAEIQALAGYQPPACFTLALSSGTNGNPPAADPVRSVACALESQYVENEVIQLTAAPDTGYHVASWSGTDDDTSTALTNHVTMPAGDHAVDVTYAPDTFSLTYIPESGGTLTGDTSQVVNYGQDGTPVTAVPDVGYHFVNWSDGSTTNPRTDTNVTADVAVTANFAPDTFTLTYRAGTGGTLSGDASQVVNYGEDGTPVTALPDTGSHFVNWSDGSTSNPRTDTNITADVNVTANFAPDTFTLNYAASAGGTLSGDTFQVVDYGGDGTAVTAVPDTGYHFVDWSDGSTENPRTDTNVTADISVTANFAPDTFTLNYSAGAGGTLTGDASQVVYYGEDGTPVTAVPDMGHYFVDWSDGSTENPRTDTNITADVSVTANFALDTFTLTYTAGTGGTLTGDTSQTVNYGEDGTAVTAVPGTGYHFVDWSDGSTANPRTDTNVMADMEVTANFAIDTFNLEYAAGAGGSLSGNTLQVVDYGGDGTPVTAVSNTGYHFVKWSDDSTANPRTDTNVTADVNVRASFTINTYTLTYTAGAHGSMDGTSPQTVNHGADGTAVTAVPDVGYHFVNWNDGSTANPRTDTNVTADVNVTANFAPDTFTLDYSAGTGGTLTGDTSQIVNYGQDGTPITAVPDTGFHFVNWSDGSTANPRTDSNITADVNVTANFALDTFTLTYTAGAGGTLSGYASQVVNYGEDGTPVEAVPNTGYHFVDWSDGSTENPRTDTNVTANVDVTADFAIDAFILNYTAGTGGTLTGETSQVVNFGEAGTPVEAVANTGYHFLDWSDGLTENPRTDTNVMADVEVTANFVINTFALEYVAGAGGSLSGNTFQVVDYGGDGTPVTAVPNTGYHFLKWSDDSTANPRTDTNVTANVNVLASFAPDTFTLNYSAGTGGTLNGDASQVVNYGQDGTAVTAVPNIGSHFVDWSDGSTANPRTDINVTADISVTANFALDTLTLNYAAGAGGSLTGEIAQVVAYGGTGTPITAVPDTGYRFVDWSDGSTENPRTDTNVTANVDVTASFAQVTYDLTIVVEGNGTTSPVAGVHTYAEGIVVDITATPAAGYVFSQWSGDCTGNGSCRVTMDSAKSVTAEFITQSITPAPPTNLQARLTSISIDLSWTDSTGPDLAGYNIYRSDSENGSYSQLNPSLVTTPFYQDSTAQVGILYSYHVTAVNIGGLESDPAVISAKRIMAFRSASSAENRGTANLTLPTPAGVVEGDLVLAVVSVRGAPRVTAPTGWTIIRNDSSADGSLRQVIYYKFASASEPPSQSWTFSSRQGASGGIVAYSGVDPTNPISAASGQANPSSTSYTAPALTANVDGSLLVGFYGIAVNAAVVPPTGMLEQIEIAMTSGKNKVATEISDEILAVAGQSGNRVATGDKAAVNIGQLVLLLPVQAAPPQDIEAPTVPQDLAATAVSSTQVDITWTPSTDNIAVAGYTVYRNGSDLGTATVSRYSDMLASPDTEYSYTVEAFDGAGNRSGQSEPVLVRTPSVPPPTGIQFRGASGSATQGSSTTLVIDRPAGSISGDLLLASIDIRDGGAITPPPGWTPILVSQAGTSLTKVTYYRVASAGEPVSYVWTFSNAETASGIILAYSGVDVSDPIVASAGQANAKSVSLTAPSVNTVLPNTMLVAFYGIATNAGITAPASMTERIEVIGSSGKIKVASEAADEGFSVAGWTEDRIATASKAEVNIGHLIALRPAAP